MGKRIRVNGMYVLPIGNVYIARTVNVRRSTAPPTTYGNRMVNSVQYRRVEMTVHA